MSLLEMIKNTESIQTHAGNYFKLHGFSYASSKGLYAAIYVIEYINANPVLRHFFGCKIENCTKREKYTKAAIYSCSYAGKVAIKYTCIIAELSNQIVLPLGRQHNCIILVAY